MSILVDHRTPVLIQGFTGDKGTFHAREMIAYGTHVVGGVTPGKGGGTHLGLPVFNTVKEAVRATGATASTVFVPPPSCADAVMEAADGGLRLAVVITDGIPAQDMMRVKRYLLRYPREKKLTLIGPNCAGVISAGKAMMGIMPGHIYEPGRVGVISRSGTLGGPQEAEAALYVRDHMTKPVVGFVAGLTAPAGRRMGHAGAIIAAFGDTAAEKAEIMRRSGLEVAPSPADLGTTMAAVLERTTPKPVPA